MNNNFIKTAGMSLVEIVIGASIITVGIMALISTHSLYIKYALTHDKDVQVVYLLEEGLEAVSFLRDKGWTANIFPLTASTTYHLYYDGTSWTRGTTTEYIDGTFVRNFAVYDVFRNNSTQQISSSGALDPNTKKVTVNVSYLQGTGTTTQSLSKYITNLYAN